MILIVDENGKEIFRSEVVAAEAPDADDLLRNWWLARDGVLVVTARWLHTYETLGMNRLNPDRRPNGVRLPVFPPLRLRAALANEPLEMPTYTVVRAINAGGRRWVVEPRDPVQMTYNLWLWPDGEMCPLVEGGPRETAPTIAWNTFTAVDEEIARRPWAQRRDE